MPKRLRLRMPADPYKAAQLRAWAAERGLQLVEARVIRVPSTGRKVSNRRRGAPNGRQYPRACRARGHVIRGPEDEVEHNKGGGKIARVCRQCRREVWAAQGRKHSARRWAERQSREAD